MEEDEVEEMDVVEEEMAEAEDEDHPVQLVDEEVVVLMRQTFHQVNLVILYSICIGKRKTKATLFHISY